VYSIQSGVLYCEVMIDGDETAEMFNIADSRSGREDYHCHRIIKKKKKTR
jgi:hypothetical protein